jgi:hypothetical protein
MRNFQHFSTQNQSQWKHSLVCCARLNRQPCNAHEALFALSNELKQTAVA